MALTRRELLKGLGGLGVCALGGAALLNDLAACNGPQFAPSVVVTPTPVVGEHMQEALYYVGLESGLDCGACHQPDEPDRVLYCHTTHGSRYVRCMLCPRGCVISEGERGECGVRENRGGKLYTMVYGNPCAVHVDPIEKKPFYHFLPGTGAFSIATAGCNLHCFYCQNWSISQSRPEETQNYDLPPESVVWYAQRTHAISVAFTYSEPTVFYEYMLATAQLARQAGLHPVVISAGYINPEPLRQLCHAVDAIKIDLKGYNDTFYHKVCDGALAPVLDAIKIIHEEGMHLEIVNLVVPTLNDAEEDMRALAHWVLDELGPDVPVHFSRFYPQYKLQNLPPTPVETVARAREIAMEAGIHYAYVGNVPGHPGNHTYCHHCGRRIIARSGFAVTEYHLVDGKCEYCGTPIPGVWHPGRGPEPGQRFEGHGPADY